MGKHITIIFLCSATMMIFAPLLSIFQWRKKLGEDWNKISWAQKFYAMAIAFLTSQSAFYLKKNDKFYKEYYVKKSFGLTEIYIHNVKLFLLPLFFLFLCAGILTAMGILK